MLNLTISCNHFLFFISVSKVTASSCFIFISLFYPNCQILKVTVTFTTLVCIQLQTFPLHSSYSGLFSHISSSDELSTAPLPTNAVNLSSASSLYCSCFEFLASVSSFVPMSKLTWKCTWKTKTCRTMDLVQNLIQISARLWMHFGNLNQVRTFKINCRALESVL